LASKSIYPNGRNSTAVTESHTRNVAGNVKTFTDGKGNETQYEYDNLGQLTKTVLPDSGDGQYNDAFYGKNGNVTFTHQKDGAEYNGTTTLYNTRNLPQTRFDASANRLTGNESYAYNEI
jgi:YD repeat-containing protein